MNPSALQVACARIALARGPTATPTPTAILILSLCLLLPTLARAELPPAQPRGFESLAEKAEVRLGEPFAYTVQVRHGADERYALAREPTLEPFEVSAASCRTEPGRDGGEALTTCALRLALFELGEHDIPDLPLVRSGPGGDQLLRIPGPRVRGASMLDPTVRADDLQLRDIAPAAKVWVRSYRALAWALLVLAAAALAGAGLLAWRRRIRATEAPASPPLLPHERFARQLDELESEGLPERGGRREYFFRLSEIVREYLGALHDLNALDLTTEELVAALARREDLGIEAEALARFCELADLVKFARHDPAEAECGEAMTFARNVLARTRPESPEAAA